MTGGTLGPVQALVCSSKSKEKGANKHLLIAHFSAQVCFSLLLILRPAIKQNFRTKLMSLPELGHAFFQDFLPHLSNCSAPFLNLYLFVMPLVCFAMVWSISSILSVGDQALKAV